MPEEKKNKTILYVIIAVVVFAIILFNMGMVNITVLDPQPFENITIHINIT